MKMTLKIASWLLIGFVTLEVCARVEDWVRYRAPLLGNYSADSIYSYDDIGKRGKPYASYLHWRMNEAGYRGPALREGTYRIACVGSSETFGLYESPAKEWPRQLEQVLHDEDPARNFEVVNTALPGMSVGAALDRLPETIARLHPNMVVVYPSYANYIGRTARQRIRSRIPRERRELRIVGRLDALWKRSAPETLQNGVRAVQVKLSTSKVQSFDRVPEGTVQLFESDLDQLVSELQQANVSVILATHATRFGDSVKPEERSLLVSWRKSYPELREDGFLDMESRMSESLVRVGERRGVPVVDAAHLIAPGPQNFAEFVHFTDQGSAQLASLLAQQIETELREQDTAKLQAHVQKLNYSH